MHYQFKKLTLKIIKENESYYGFYDNYSRTYKTIPYSTYKDAMDVLVQYTLSIDNFNLMYCDFVKRELTDEERFDLVDRKLERYLKL